MDSFLASLTAEIKNIFHSTYKLFLLFLLPFFLSFFIIEIFGDGALKDLPIAVVDKDKSTFSNKLIHAFDDTSTLHVSLCANSLHQAIQALQNTKVYAVVVIEKEFQNDIVKHHSPKINVFLNTQYILIGKIVFSTLSSTAMELSAQIETIQKLTKSKVLSKALSLTLPISLKTVPLFNTYQNYFYFLVTAVLPAIWQILLTLSAIVTVAQFHANDPKLFYSRPFTGIFAKLLPGMVVFFLWSVIFLYYIYGVHGWQFMGDMGTVLLATVLCIVAYNILGVLFYVILFDYTEALSIAAVYTAPAFAFIGITFPASDMNGFAIFWREMLPITHLMEIFISQANYASPLRFETENLLLLSCFSFLSIPVLWRIRQKGTACVL